MKDDGFSAFKIKVGANTIPEDLSRAENLRRVLGEHIQLTADANAGYSSKDALASLCSNEVNSGVNLYLGCCGWSPGQLENELKSKMFCKFFPGN